MNKIILTLMILLGLQSMSLADDYPVFTYTLNDAIIESSATQKDVLLIFTADWCKYCVSMKNDISKNPDSLKDLVISYVDINEYPELARQYKVKQLPDYMIVRKTKVVARKTGYKNFDSFKKWLTNVK
jgi:thioredoxin 1